MASHLYVFFRTQIQIHYWHMHNHTNMSMALVCLSHDKPNLHLQVKFTFTSQNQTPRYSNVTPFASLSQKRVYPLSTPFNWWLVFYMDKHKHKQNHTRTCANKVRRMLVFYYTDSFRAAGVEILRNIAQSGSLFDH